MTVISPPVANNRIAKSLNSLDLTKQGDRIAYLRLTNLMEQPEFAAVLKTKAPAVSRWENGAGISARQASAMAEAFGTTVDWITRGVGRKPEPINKNVSRGTYAIRESSDRYRPTEGAGQTTSWERAANSVAAREYLGELRETLHGLGADENEEDSAIRMVRRVGVAGFAVGGTRREWTEEAALEEMQKEGKRFIAYFEELKRRR